jgi:thiamine-monophosphate kinase
VPVGPGDDCAVIRLGRVKVLLTTDMLIEGRHFRRDWMSPEEIGAKAMLVNLSDIAAMGGDPRFALLSVGLPRSFSVSEADRLFRGMREVARKNGVTIVGGDTNAADRLIVNVTLIGEATAGRVLTRSGAREGDFIYVTGTLGDAALALRARRHRLPPCRIKIGKKLARDRRVHSLIDLSDGLAGDLRHILEASGVGAEIDRGAVPVSPGFLEGAKRLGLDPDRLKLAGGEDYELLFTASPPLPSKIDGVPITKIGTILPKRFGLRWIDSQGRRYSKKIYGFRHF